ncbi:MAG: PKD-like domain-containing protein [Fulvivirga sp.]
MSKVNSTIYRLSLLILSTLMAWVMSGNAAFAQCFTLSSDYCVDETTVSLSGCSSYVGPGVSGTNFDPSSAGVGNHTIYGINGAITTYSVDQAGTFNPISGSGTAIPLQDDGGANESFLLSIPFNFDFYGNTYSQVYLDNNGYLQFGGTQTDFSPNAIPNVANPNDIIAFSWADFDPERGGETIEYFTSGSSPQRVFVINFNDVQYYNGDVPTTATVSIQVQLHESTNIIEVHSTNIDSDGINNVQGVENSTGSAGVAVTGRNETTWTAVNDFVAFIPDNVTIETTTVNNVPSNGLALNYDAINVCESETITIEVVSSEAGVNYQILDQSLSPVSGVVAGTGANIDIETNALSTSETSLTLRATNASTNCDADFGTQAITVDVQPTADAGTGGDICGIGVGNPFTFSATAATGTGTWTMTSGPGTPSFVDANVETTDVTVDTYGTYVFRWTDVNGTCSDFDEITVNFYEIPDATTNLASYAICDGETSNVLISNPNSVSGTTFNWTIGTVTGTVSGQVAGSGNVITQTLSSTAGGSVEYLITPTANGCVGASISRTIVVDPIPVGNAVSAGTYEVCAGTMLAITPTTNVAGSTFTWFGDNGSGGTGDIDDAPLNNTNAAIDITYTVTPTGPGTTFCEGNDFDIVVTVNPNPSLSITNNADEICSGDLTDITLNTPTSNAEINLVDVTYGAVTGGTLTSGDKFTDGANIAETLNNATTAAIDVIYEFNVTTTDGCPVAAPASQFVTVTVSPAPTFTVTNNAAVLCSEELTDIDITSTTSGAVIELINVTASPSIVGVPAVGSTYLNGANISRQLTNTSNMAETVTFEFEVSLNNCVNPATQIVNIDVNPIPTLTTSVETQTICDGETTSIDLTNPNAVPGTSYSWTVSANSVGATAGNSGGADVYTIAQMLNNASNTPQSVTYTITPAASGCNGNSKNVIVTVNPTPTLATTGDETLCSGETTSISLSNPNSVSGTSFSWQVISNINSVSGATNGSGTLINQTLFVNSSSPPGSVTYRITPSANNCDGAFEDVTVTVNPQPVVFAGFDYEICADAGVIELTASLTGSATSGTWTGGNNDPGGYSSNPVIDGETIEYTFNQTDSTNGFVTFTLTSDDPDGAGPCTAAADQITVIINDLPTVSFGGLPDSVAENDPAISLTGSPSGGIFSGDGISGNSFNPPGGTVGVFNFVTYTYTDPSTGCVNSATDSVFINGKPDIEIGNDNVQVCFSDDPDLLEATPTGGVWTGTGVANIGGDDYEFTPSTAGIGTHILTYTFTDENNATNSADITYEVYPNPDVNFTPVNLCFDEPIEFTDLTTVDNSVWTAALVEWDWSFFDDNGVIVGASSDQNPEIQFSVPGDKRIVLTVTSEADGFRCTATHEEIITIGSVPDVFFNWQSVCNGDFTAFNNQTILDIGDQNSLVYDWDFDDGNSISGLGTDPVNITHADGSETVGTFANPEHRYNDVGDYDVVLSANTAEGCSKDFVQNIDILPQTQIDDFPYEVNFDLNDGDWAEEVELLRDTSQISDNSWLYSASGAGEILPKYSGDGFWWTGANTDSYYNNEQSWVNGPCFDLSLVDRPMISMDVASSTDEGFDGAVLQYSADGGITWENIGSLVENGGINWYNSNSISAKPGDQPFGFGWTGSTEDLTSEDDSGLTWIRVSHNLNAVKGLTNVLLRVAFGSNSDNSAEQKNGFAFDNVYVGEKKRLVLVENFTDTQIDISNNSNQYLENIRQNQIAAIGATDFSILHYHIDDSGEDPFYLDNTGDPSSRSLFYGVSQAPSTVLDGNQFSGFPFEITELDIDRRSLEDPQFDLSIDTLASAGDVMSAAITVTSNITFTDQINVQLAVIENGIDYNGITYNNVIKKLILGGQGETLKISWTPGTQSTVNAEWNVDVEIFDPSNLTLVAFVQDKTTREIYGTAVVKAPEKDERTVTGIDDNIISQVKNIEIYPNPANGVLNFALNTNELDDYNWKIVDQRGVTLLEGDINFVDGHYSTSTRDLANGIYYVVIGKSDKPLIYRKLAVMNRE